MKKILILILCCVLAIFPISACGNDDGLKTIEVNEVTHSVFYAPLYVAIEKGYFAEEGLKINLTNGGGADKSMTAVLSGTADIGLMGPETVIYVYKQGKTDMPKVFGQLTKTDGSFLVSKVQEDNFDWNSLRGKEILAGRKGGVPAMTFEYVMHELGMENGVDYTLNFDVQFNLMTSAFLGGVGDYCTVFEPTASEYQAEGKWFIADSVGSKAGEIPYTSFIALESFMNDNPETIKSFLKAIKKAHDFIKNNTEYVVAESIVKQFPSTTIKSIETSLKSYKAIDAWKLNLQATENSFTRLQEIMMFANELDNPVPFDKLVDNTHAKAVFG